MNLPDEIEIEVTKLDIYDADLVLRPAVYCAACGEECKPNGSIDTGYGVDKHDNKLCYACCAENDKQRMRETGRATLYLISEPDTPTAHNGGKKWFVSNWPGSLKIRVPHTIKRSRHNFARVRYDFWFPFEGYWWHGYQIGDNTQIAHCKRTKEVVE